MYEYYLTLLFRVGEYVINQGEHGDHLFVVDSGILDCYRAANKNSEPKMLKSYIPGESFGELALLYNSPRAASVKVVQKATLFSLDRECFNYIIKDAAIKKRDRYEEFLSKLELLSTMEPYEKAKIAESLKSVKFQKNDYIVREVIFSKFVG